MELLARIPAATINHLGASFFGPSTKLKSPWQIGSATSSYQNTELAQDLDNHHGVRPRNGWDSRNDGRAEFFQISSLFVGTGRYGELDFFCKHVSEQWQLCNELFEAAWRFSCTRLIAFGIVALHSSLCPKQPVLCKKILRVISFLALLHADTSPATTCFASIYSIDFFRTCTRFPKACTSIRDYILLSMALQQERTSKRREVNIWLTILHSRDSLVQWDQRVRDGDMAKAKVEMGNNTDCDRNRKTIRLKFLRC